MPLSSLNSDSPPQEPAAAELWNAQARGPVLLICEHASNRIPAGYGDLGLSDAAKNSHAAWDPGALAVAQHMAKMLDGRLVASTVSRLVYDCNRPPESPGAMPAKSEVFDIPGNADLSQQARDLRVDQVYNPFKNLLADSIQNAPQPPVLVTIHSFTRVYLGSPRAVEIGILHDTDTRLADEMLTLAEDHTDMNVQRNAPYGPQDGVTYTLKLHGLKNGLLNVMLEVRNDLIATDTTQKQVATMLAGLISAALKNLGIPPKNRLVK